MHIYISFILFLSLIQFLARLLARIRIFSFSFSFLSLCRREKCIYIYKFFTFTLVTLNCVCFTSIDKHVSTLVRKTPDFWRVTYLFIFADASSNAFFDCNRSCVMRHGSACRSFIYYFCFFICYFFFSARSGLVLECRLQCARGLFRTRPRRGKCHPWRPPSVHPGPRTLGPL